MESLNEKMENFADSGPKLNRKLDWNDLAQKRIGLACLVHSVYMLQADIEAKRQKGQTFAQEWWKYTNYHLKEVIMNTKETHINGAIFKWKGFRCWKPEPAPLIVVAFRGTFLRSEASNSDLEVDYKIIGQVLHKAQRFDTAFRTVAELVNRYKPWNVCVAGHSLGAAIGLLVARKLAEDGCKLEAHLFNPPFVSIPLELLAGKTISLAMNVIFAFATAGLAFLLKNFEHSKQVTEAFTAVESWIPDIYINVKDMVCSGYLEYFNARKAISSRRSLLNLSAPFSFRGQLHFMHGMDAKPYHLIPSARLHVKSKNCSKGYFSAHSLSEWWSTEESHLETVIAKVDGHEHISQ